MMAPRPPVVKASGEVTVMTTPVWLFNPSAFAHELSPNPTTIAVARCRGGRIKPTSAVSCANVARR